MRSCDLESYLSGMTQKVSTSTSVRNACPRAMAALSTSQESLALNGQSYCSCVTKSSKVRTVIVIGICRYLQIYLMILTKANFSKEGRTKNFYCDLIQVSNARFRKFLINFPLVIDLKKVHNIDTHIFTSFYFIIITRTITRTCHLIDKETTYMYILHRLRHCTSIINIHSFILSFSRTN